jgi:hypothetical protein
MIGKFVGTFYGIPYGRGSRIKIHANSETNGAEGRRERECCEPGTYNAVYLNAVEVKGDTNGSMYIYYLPGMAQVLSVS